jgi:uncharacterized protein (UPF0297 family)
MKAGKNKWIKPGAKIIVKGDDCWANEARGEILKIEKDQILVRVVEEYWVTKHDIEEDST